VTNLVARSTIEADSGETLQQVFEKLVANKIQSVPIYSNQKQKYIGIREFCVVAH
jgi:hypothetical protein